jgi:hypothetical protein
VTSDDGVSVPARRLAAAVEPFAGQVYFSPECHAGYARLGFNASPGETSDGVALPDGAAYFASRGSILGQVPGEVVAAAFGVFNPAVVVPSVSFGWSITDAATIGEARTDGAVGQLHRILGSRPEGTAEAVALLERATAPLRPEGHPLFAGLLGLGLPGEPVADAWRLTDRLREFRGDAHIAAWTSAGYDAVEIGLLTELWWGLPARSYVRTRAWSDDDLDAGQERLRSRGLIDGDGALTRDGRAAREVIEVATDRQVRPALDALGEDLSALLDHLEPWSRAVRDARGYLPTGPHDLASGARPPT